MAIAMLGVPAGQGAGCRGTEAAPRALRAAGLRRALSALGRAVEDHGDVAPAAVAPAAVAPFAQANPALKALPEVAAWSRAIHDAVLALPAGCTPLILGGDHSISLGSVPALAARAAAAGRPFFVLWIDAHPDCHTLATSVSGNLHGLPLAHAIAGGGTGSPFPDAAPRVRGDDVVLLGVREVDEAEADFLGAHRVTVHGPDALRRRGAAALLQPWLRRIADVGGILHVSLDADALEPEVAPGVGTPVAGGLSLTEVCDALAAAKEAGVIGSLELVEINPFLDVEGRTAKAMIAATAEALRPAAAGQRRVG